VQAVRGLFSTGHARGHAEFMPNSPQPSRHVKERTPSEAPSDGVALYCLLRLCWVGQHQAPCGLRRNQRHGRNPGRLASAAADAKASRMSDPLGELLLFGAATTGGMLIALLLTYVAFNSLSGSRAASLGVCAAGVFILESVFRVREYGDKSVDLQIMVKVVS